MKRQNLRTVSLIVVTFTYLLLGAAIFGYLESDHEVRQRENLELIELIVKRKYNISEDDFTVLTTTVIKSVPHKAGIQWKFPGAFYFATTVVTTIGYGHSTPATMAGRSFCMIYALIGIPLGLVMFQSIGERLNTFVGSALRHAKRCFKAANPEVTQTNLVMVVLVLSTILMTSMAAVFAKYERWDYFDALYYCFITLTTIGFGDYVALQKESALQSKPEYVALSLIFILFGLSVVSSAVNLLVLKFLTLNTEDERRDEQLRYTAELNPIQLEGDVITSTAGSFRYAASKSNPVSQSNELSAKGTQMNVSGHDVNSKSSLDLSGCRQRKGLHRREQGRWPRSERRLGPEDGGDYGEELDDNEIDQRRPIVPCASSCALPLSESHGRHTHRTHHRPRRHHRHHGSRPHNHHRHRHHSHSHWSPVHTCSSHECSEHDDDDILDDEGLLPADGDAKVSESSDFDELTGEDDGRFHCSHHRHYARQCTHRRPRRPEISALEIMPPVRRPRRLELGVGGNYNENKCATNNLASPIQLPVASASTQEARASQTITKPVQPAQITMISGSSMMRSTDPAMGYVIKQHAPASQPERLLLPMSLERPTMQRALTQPQVAPVSQRNIHDRERPSCVHDQLHKQTRSHPHQPHDHLRHRQSQLHRSYASHRCQKSSSSQLPETSRALQPYGAGTSTQLDSSPSLCDCMLPGRGNNGDLILPSNQTDASKQAAPVSREELMSSCSCSWLQMMSTAPTTSGPSQRLVDGNAQYSHFLTLGTSGLIRQHSHGQLSHVQACGGGASQSRPISGELALPFHSRQRSLDRSVDQPPKRRPQRHEPKLKPSCHPNVPGGVDESQNNWDLETQNTL